MAKSMYESLGVSSSADQELIEHAFNLIVQRNRPLADAGDESAKTRLFAAREAYQVLGDPLRRQAYDAKLTQPVPRRSHVAVVEPERGVWGGPTPWIVGASVAVLLGWGVKNHYDTKAELALRKQAMEMEAEAKASRIEVERKLVDGVVRNDASAIQVRQELGNRSIGVQEQAIQRHSSTTDRMIDLRKTDQEERIARQQQMEAERRERTARLEQERQQRDAQRVADREARYWQCMNAAIDRYGSERALTMCRR